MFGNTITLDLSADETPAEITLVRINQDGYSSEYFLKESDRSHTVLIRHSKEKAKQRGREVERHNVTYTQRFFPTDLNPQGREIQAYSVIRNASEDAVLDVKPLVDAMTKFTAANSVGLLSWES